MADEWRPDPTVLNDIIEKFKQDGPLDEKGIVFPGYPGSYSANDVIREVQQGTMLGQDIYKAHYELMHMNF